MDEIPFETDFETDLRSLSLALKINEDSYNFFLQECKFDDFEFKLKQHGMEFVVRGSSLKRHAKQTVKWKSPNIPFLKVPFAIENVIWKQCAVGPKYYKKRSSEDSSMNGSDDSIVKRKRYYAQPTKKIGCNATMKIFKIIAYPQYRLKAIANIKEEKTKILRTLRERLQSGMPVVTEILFYVTMSMPKVHSHPVWTTFINQKLDPRLKSKIFECVKEGITNAQRVETILSKWVRENIGDQISKSSRAFYPTKKIVRNYILKYTYITKQNKMDIAALKQKIESWSSQNIENKYYYRPYSEDRYESFMFCYQNEWQSRLLQRYGTVVVLDSTYRTTNYSLPLFSLLVKTNVSYMIVGVFVIQWETSAQIAEALNVFKTWNKEWQPNYFLTDLSDLEITAVKSCFDCKIYICDFYRDQGWIKWFLKKDNIDKDDANILLNYFRKLGESRCDDEFSTIENAMRSTESWKRNKKVQNYFLTVWLPAKEMWTQAFFDEDYLFIINTNDGIQNQHKILKHSYLKSHIGKNLCEVLDVIDDSLNNTFRIYQNNNSVLDIDNKDYDKEIQTFLQNRPSLFIRHVYECYTTAQNIFTQDSIAVLQNSEKTLFIIKSEINEHEEHTVDFSVPLCTCLNFARYRFPCEHICAVILFVPEFSFECLPSKYRDSPFLTIDLDYSYFVSEYPAELDEFDDGTIIEVHSPSGIIIEEKSSSYILPDTEAMSLTENSVSMESIRELLKDMYDRSLLLTSNSSDSEVDITVLYEKLCEAHILMQKFLE